MIYQPLIQDRDSNTMFGLESASVSLLDAPDVASERIGVSNQTILGLSAMGVSVTRGNSLLLHYLIFVNHLCNGCRPHRKTYVVVFQVHFF